MFGIPLPWLILGVTIALFGSYRGGYHFGWSDRDAEMQIEIAKKNEEARVKEQAAVEKINATATKLQEANDALTQKTTALARANRAGQLRLCPSSNLQTPATPAPAAPDTKATSQPDRAPDQPSDAERATIEAIAEIVAQGDKNTAALNACVDSYNQMRDLLNDKR